MLVLVSGAYLALVLLLVAIPVSWSAELAKTQRRVHGTYIAEDVALRALEKGLLRRGGTMTLPQGPLSPFPDQSAEVLWLPRRNRSSVLCILGAQGQEGRRDQYLADFVRGSLPRAFSWALGEGKPSKKGEQVFIRGIRGALHASPGSDPVAPLVGGSWEGRADLLVGEMGVRPLLQPCPDLPIRFLGTSTDQEDYFLGSTGERREVCLGLGESQASVIRIPGNLWLGLPGRETRISATTDSLVFLVDGNLYVQGRVRPSRRGLKLYFLVGRPGGAGTEVSEGRGRAWLGLGDRGCFLEATVVARGDLIPTGGRVELRGAFLAGGHMEFQGRKGLLTIQGPRPEDLPLRPRRGLPLVPGSEDQFWILSIRRIGED